MPMSRAKLRRTPVTRSKRSPPVFLSANPTRPSPSSMQSTSTSMSFLNSSEIAFGLPSPAPAGRSDAGTVPAPRFLLAFATAATAAFSAASASVFFNFQAKTPRMIDRVRKGSTGIPGTRANTPIMPAAIPMARG